MECENCDAHVLKLNDEEFALLKESLSFYHECTIKSQEFKNDESSTIKTAIILEQMGKAVGLQL